MTARTLTHLFVLSAGALSLAAGIGILFYGHPAVFSSLGPGLVAAAGAAILCVAIFVVSMARDRAEKASQAKSHFLAIMSHEKIGRAHV